MQLSIQKKILLFLLLPLVVETAFSCLLYALNDSIERYAAAERSQREVVQHLNRLSALLGNSLTTIFYRDTTRDTTNPLASRSDRLNELTNEFAALKILTKSDLELSKQVIELEPILDQQFKTLLYLHSIPSAFLNVTDFQSDRFHELMRSMSTVTNKLANTLKQQQIILDERQNEQQNARQRLKTFAVVGIVCNCLLALIIALAFLADLRKRLNLLIDNARHMSEGRAFNPVSGQDELSFLNSIMQHTSEQLHEAQKSRQHLMQMIAHDLRTPITALQINVDTMIYRPTDEYGETTQNRLSKMKGFISKVIELTDDLLLLEKLEGGGLELSHDLVDIRTVVDGCLESIGDLTEKKTIGLKNSCDSLTVTADEKRIAQVLTNLLSNAIKVSPPNSQIEVSSQKRSDSVQVSIIDQGPGLSRIEQEKIFSRFYQSEKGSTNGFGIGLAIVKSLVEAHGGTVGIESAVGKGSRFWFTIPLSRTPPDSPATLDKKAATDRLHIED
jgi:signal transduction histidine kinase